MIDLQRFSGDGLYRLYIWCTVASARGTVTGQLADTPTRELPTRGLDDSRTGQLADATGDFACLVFVLLAASARPRVVESASWQSASWRIRELSSYRWYLADTALPTAISIPIIPASIPPAAKGFILPRVYYPAGERAFPSVEPRICLRTFTTLEFGVLWTHFRT